MVFRQTGNDIKNLAVNFGLLNKSFANIQKDFQNGHGIRSLGNFVSPTDVRNLQVFNQELKHGASFHKAYNSLLSKSHTFIQQQALDLRELYTQQKVLSRQLRQGKITQQEYNAQMQANRTQIQTLIDGTNNLTLAQKAATVASKILGTTINMAFNVGIGMLISFIITQITKLVNRQKELAEKSKELGNAAKDTAKDVSSLYAEYLKLNEAVANGTGSKEDLKNATDNLLNSLELEGIAVDELIKKYGTLEEAMTQISIEKLKEAHNNLVGSVGVYEKELLNQGKNGVWARNNFTLTQDSKDLKVKTLNNENVIDVLRNIENIKLEIGTMGNDISYTFKLLGDTKTTDGIKQNYETLMEMQDTLVTKFGSEQVKSITIYNTITNRLNELKTAYENYINEVTALNDSAAQIAIFEGLKGKELPKTQEEFNAFLDGLINDATTAGSELRNQFIGTDKEIANSIKSAISGMSVFDEFTLESIPIEVPIVPFVSADTSSLKSNLAKLKEEIDDILKNTNLFDKAIESLSKGESIDFDSVMSMVEVDSSLADKFIKTADGYTIAVDTLTEARQNYTQSTRESIQADIALAKQSISTAENNIKVLEEKRDELLSNGINSPGDAALLDKYNAGIQTEKDNIEELNGTLSENELILSGVNDSASGVASSYQTLQKSIEDTANKTSVMKKAMEEMSDTGYISADTYADLVKLGGNFTDCLEVQNGRLVLNVKKLKELETQEYKNIVSAKQLLIGRLELIRESRAAAGLDTSFIDEQINNLRVEQAGYQSIIDEIENTKPDDKSKNSDDPWKDEFDKEYAAKKHELEMNRISEEKYINWLDGAYKKYFSDKTKYLDEYNKYEEEVYKYSKDREQELFEQRIDNHKKLADNALDKNIDGEGNNLSVTASFDYARAEINSAISDVQARIDQLSLIPGSEDEIEELRKEIEGFYDDLEDINDKERESEIDYIEKQKKDFSDMIDSDIDNIERESDAVEKAYDKKIEAIDKQSDAYDKQADNIDKEIEAIEKTNEAEKRKTDILEAQKKVKEAELELEKAHVKNRLVYTGNGRWEAREDKDAVKEAEENLASAKAELAEKLQEEQVNILKDQKKDIEEQKDILEEQKKVFEEAKDNADEYYSDIKENLEKQKDTGEKTYDALIDILENTDGKTVQNASNSDLYNRLAGSDDLKKAVDGLSPSEKQAVFDSGLVQIDDSGNYLLDYTAVDDNSQAVKDNTAATENLDSTLQKFMPENYDEGNTDDVTDTAKDNNNNNNGSKVKPVTYDEWKKRHKLSEYAPKGKDVPDITFEEYLQKDEKDNATKISSSSLEEYFKKSGLYQLAQQAIGDVATVAFPTANEMFGRQMQTVIGGQNFKNDSVVNNVTDKPQFNCTINIEGSADEKTVDRMRSEMDSALCEYTNTFTSIINSEFMKRKYKA